MEGKQVIGAEEMAGKVRAMAATRKRLGMDLIINARTDACAIYGLKEAIRRANVYLQNGADIAFIDGIRTRADIERAVREVKGLLSLNLMDAVSGVKTELVPIPELAQMGVARVSIPVASILVAHRALKRFFEAMRASPTGLLEGQNDWLSSFDEYTGFVGLKEYRRQEDEFLPRATIEEKYAV
jgi:methylisocitrate lyase